jgi:Ca2+-binding RTX toxin-like protein
MIVSNEFAVARIDGTGAVPTPGKVFMEGTMLTIEGNNADNEMEAGQYVDIALFVRIDTYSDVVSLDGVDRVRVRGLGGNDHVTGLHMTGDTLAGGSGDDLVEQRFGSGNVLYGESGNDVLHGDGGNDSVYGNDGDDTLVSDNHGDLFYGSAGTDTIDYTSRSADLRISLDGIANDGEAGENGNVMFDIERVLSGSGNDYLVGNEAANVLYGGGGNDILDGRGGNDALFGQSGHDILSGRDGNDRLDGGSGSDSLYGQSGFDTLLGQDGNDVLFGLGDGSIDLLDGGSGSDWARKDPSDTAISIEHYF